MAELTNDTQGTTSFKDWDYKKYHVQKTLEGGNFISGATVLICATKPRLSDLSSNASSIAYPLGVVAQMSIQQNKQLQRIFEIGSYRSYFIPGRVMGGLSLARMYFHGPSLLNALYKIRGGDTEDLATAGKNEFYVNLASNLFNKPIGILAYLKDTDGKNVAGMLFEDCYIQAHSFSVGSEQIVISENVQCQFDRCVPVEV